MTTDKFKQPPEIDGDPAIEVDGFTLRAFLLYDGDQREPWTDAAGHGTVSDWRPRGRNGYYPSAPGELLLLDDGRSARFYDFAGAVKAALAEGWDAEPYNTGRETPRQQAVKAAKADFQYLKAWCNDEWHYVGVVVSAHRAGVELGSASVWGIISDAGGYLTDAANGLIGDALTEARATLASLCECDKAA